ncbi:Spermatocyte protein spe-11 [Caenorhabditis elegans]|uniref:Spermatocyte protein spe-11 n=1 Tax=Caenorhabditis elegans TaxID=6239 RepID=SPE11_CAEEL|nr:Spermatocyte protein spe-11 [Caenorhabditis elegans]P54217.1 RecName: Full=Spermatocyte protein spe-11; AltName: Full=Defective spermatogenesis protein 11 [Caenorhabditis elegans]AAA97861.1 SPE-11 [Caenorhabditis elegans]CCD62474.1 Spermatocyte protein spe-11 [Caenorhabditis elegans]|eukprot:NP_491569.1 Spermatocyte protein spe-11 [Caenorhabditis elegans]
MSDEEIDISTALNNKTTPKKKSLKRNSNSQEGYESPEEREIVYPSVFGAIGTPMAKSDNAKEWDEWKEKERKKDKAEWKRYLRSKWDMTQGHLPLVSDSEFLKGRKEHKEYNSKARMDILDGLDEVNEGFFNCGKGAAMNIRYNDKNVSKKGAKKFVATVETAMKKAGNPTMEQMMTDDLDEDEARAEAEWERQREQRKLASRAYDAAMDEREDDAKYVPWDEYCQEMEELGKELKIGEKHYKKWLEKKMDENKVTHKFNAYQLDLKCLDEDAFSNKKSLKSVVRNVQKFYRKMREPKK